MENKKDNAIAELEAMRLRLLELADMYDPKRNFNKDISGALDSAAATLKVAQIRIRG